MSRKGSSGWRKVWIILVVLAILAAGGRAIMPWFVRNYVNRTLDRSPLYSGKIGKVTIHLWRRAFSIQNVRISKSTGDVPVPFFSAKRLDFAVEWRALLHHKVVGRLLI